VADRVILILQAVEIVPNANSIDESGHRADSRRRSRADELKLELEKMTLPYLVSIWRRRAEIMGGIPMLDLHGGKLVLSHLKEDGRCRSFAVGSVFPD
jgi:hypothetical protein